MSKLLKRKSNKVIYELPIIITKKDLKIEKIYSDFYNEEYWEKYKLKE